MEYGIYIVPTLISIMRFHRDELYDSGRGAEGSSGYKAAVPENIWSYVKSTV